jgi:hypothetical protein
MRSLKTIALTFCREYAKLPDNGAARSLNGSLSPARPSREFATAAGRRRNQAQHARLMATRKVSPVLHLAHSKLRRSKPGLSGSMQANLIGLPLKSGLG